MHSDSGEKRQSRSRPQVSTWALLTLPQLAALAEMRAGQTRCTGVYEELS